MKCLRLFLLVAAAWFLLVVSTVRAQSPPPGFKNTGTPGGALMGEIPGPGAASFSFNGVFTLGDLVLCEDTSCGATVDAAGAVTAYTGNVSDVVQFRHDPNDPNSTLVTMYSDIDGSEGAINNDVFSYPLGTTNFLIIQEAPLTPNGPTGFPAEQNIYIPPGGNFAWTFVSDIASPPLNPTPEPSSLLLLGSGLLGIGGLLRRLGLA